MCRAWYSFLSMRGDGAVVFGMQFGIGGLVALQELLRLGVGQDPHAQDTRSCASVSGSFSKPSLSGLRGQELHGDQLVQHLIFLLRRQLLLLALQQVFHIDVVIRCAISAYR